MSLGHAEGIPFRTPARVKVIIPMMIASIIDYFDVLSQNFQMAEKGYVTDADREEGECLAMAIPR